MQDYANKDDDFLFEPIIYKKNISVNWNYPIYDGIISYDLVASKVGADSSYGCLCRLNITKELLITKDCLLHADDFLCWNFVEKEERTKYYHKQLIFDAHCFSVRPVTKIPIVKYCDEGKGHQKFNITGDRHLVSIYATLAFNVATTKFHLTNSLDNYYKTVDRYFISTKSLPQNFHQSFMV